MAEIHLIKLRTERFRNSLDPLWVRMRHLLIQRDFDPLAMVLAYFVEESFKFRFGILLDRDGRVFQFGFDFSGGKSADGRFAEWDEITGTWKRGAFRRPVAEAMKVLELESKAGD
jgi:hypothetical protein